MASGEEFQNTSLFNRTNSLLKDCSHPYVSGVLLCVFSVFVSLVGFVGNTLVCLAFFKTPSLRTLSHFMILNLCVADWFTVVLGLPFQVVWIWLRSVDGACLPYAMLFARRSVISFCTSSSLALLGLVSIERFIVIYWPLKHKTIVTPTRCIVLVSICWVGGFIYGILSAIDEHRMETSLFAMAATVNCFVMIIVCYTCIFVKLSKQSKVRASLNAQHNQTHSVEKRTAKTIALIICIYGVCYIPYTVERFFLPDDKYGRRDWFLVLALVHSALDPVVYFFRSSEFKAAFGALLHTRPRGVRHSTKIHPANITHKDESL